MKIIPSPCLVGMDDAPSGDALANDRHGLGLMLYNGCQGLAATLAHDHDAKALAVLVFAPTPINASDAIIFGPNIAAEPTTVDFNDPFNVVVAEFEVKAHRNL